MPLCKARTLWRPLKHFRKKQDNNIWTYASASHAKYEVKSPCLGRKIIGNAMTSCSLLFKKKTNPKQQVKEVNWYQILSSWPLFFHNPYWHKEVPSPSTRTHLHLKWETKQASVLTSNVTLRSHLNPKTLKLPQYHPFSPESFLDTRSASHALSWTGLIN